MSENTPRREPATRLYVIGDIHGRSDLLDLMVEKIRADLEACTAPSCLTVTLGDYIDRGPDSRGVIDRLCRNPFPTPYVPLKGNHEAMLELSLREPNAIEEWRRWGGLETLCSYGVPVASLMLGRGFEEASRALRAVLPPEHQHFIASLECSYATDDCFLCHAGVRPGIALARQRTEDLLWIREDFLKSSATFGKRVIHGHTPVERPEIRPNRINIDTGAFATGRLTCLVVEQGRMRFLSTK
jgi:serine/threonine protein phosphatase 1